MGQDLGFDWAGTAPTVTLLSSDVTDTNVSTITAAVDFGAISPVAFGFELILTTLTAAVDWCYLEIAWSHDNSDFSDLLNMQNVASVLCAASTDVKYVGSHALQGRYAKFRLRNESGGSIDGTASNTALIFTDVFYDQV